jgi:hypothetical protein
MNHPVGTVPGEHPAQLHAVVLTHHDTRTMCTDDGAELLPGLFDPLVEGACVKCRELVERI